MAEAREFAARFTDAPDQCDRSCQEHLNQSFNLDHRTMLELEAMAQSIARDGQFHKEAIRRFRGQGTAALRLGCAARQAAE